MSIKKNDVATPKRATTNGMGDTTGINRSDYIRIRNTMQADTHVARLFDYLWLHGKITSAECFDRLGNTRISSTVSQLRNVYDIPVKTDMASRKVCGKRVEYGVYSFERCL